MSFIPEVRKKIMKHRIEKILETKETNDLDSQCHELSIENFIGKKLDFFFDRIGKHHADGLYDVVIESVERSLITKTLKWSNGNKIKAALILGINRNTLNSKIKKLKLKF